MKSVKKVCAKVKEQTLSIFKPVKNEEVVQRVNKILVGWGHSQVSCGEPYAGKLHVRFDEGAGVAHGASRSTLHPSHTESL